MTVRTLPELALNPLIGCLEEPDRVLEAVNTLNHVHYVLEIVGCWPSD